MSKYTKEQQENLLAAIADDRYVTMLEKNELLRAALVTVITAYDDEKDALSSCIEYARSVLWPDDHNIEGG